jgi:2,3-dihydroxybenzoate-AMP ligase
MPDERLGERACAYLVARGEPLSMSAMQAHLAGLGVAKFKWPERLEWVDELPRTAVNKVDKKALRQDLAAKLDTEAQGGSW